MHKILKLKCGGITWTKELEKWYHDRFSKYNGCICCTRKPENLEHFIMECERFNGLRAQTIKSYLVEKNLTSFLKKVIEDVKVFNFLIFFFFFSCLRLFLLLLLSIFYKEIGFIFENLDFLSFSCFLKLIWYSFFGI